MKQNRTFLYPILLGIIIGVGILVFNPEAGSGVGNLLYSSGVEKQSYAYGVSRAAPSVVNIYVSTLNSDYNQSSPSSESITVSASGVIMTENGYVVTNYHVITSIGEKNKAVWVQTREGKVYQAMVVGYDRRTDIAVLKVDARNLPTIPMMKNYNAQVGDLVLAIGNPNNLGQTVTHGIISATARAGSGLLTHEQMNLREGLQDLIQTDAPINVGNSGGALVNTNGELVGINTASFTSQQHGTYGIGFAVPTKLVTYVMNEIIQHGRVIRGYLGISDAGTVALTETGDVGIRVGFVDPNSPAAKSGIRRGDVITSVDGKTMQKVRNLIDIISNSSPGTTLDFTLFREGRTLSTKVTLVEDLNELPR